MKTTTQKAIRSVYGLCLVMLVYACTNKTADPLSPFTTEALTKQLKELKLPTLRLTAPNPVVTTSATISPSSQATSLYTAIAQNPSAPVVSQAITDMNTALAATSNTAADINSSFTPQVLNNLAAGGQLPSALQTKVDALVAQASLQSYLPTATYPTVNGQTVSPTTTSVVGPTPITSFVKAVVVAPINYSGDPCFKAANDLFDQTIQGLDTGLASQIDQINSVYATEKSSAESDRPSCVSSQLSQYTTLILSAGQGLTTNLNNLNAAQATIGAPGTATLKALIYVLYSYQIQLYYKVQTAEINTCSIKTDIRLAEAKLARDTDLNAANTGFNTTVITGQGLVLQLYDSCHNQGSAQ